jgi:hypothetical protein
VNSTLSETPVVTRADLKLSRFQTVFLADSLTDPSRAELLKVLTPEQREALERLSGLTFEKKR